MVNFRLEEKPDSHHSAMLGGTIAPASNGSEGDFEAALILAQHRG